MNAPSSFAAQLDEILGEARARQYRQEDLAVSLLFHIMQINDSSGRLLDIRELTAHINQEDETSYTTAEVSEVLNQMKWDGLVTVTPGENTWSIADPKRESVRALLLTA